MAPGAKDATRHPPITPTHADGRAIAHTAHTGTMDSAHTMPKVAGAAVTHPPIAPRRAGRGAGCGHCPPSRVLGAVDVVEVDKSANLALR
jgi:hypothetical protein